jgi:cephalosporin hydroxylase
MTACRKPALKPVSELSLDKDPPAGRAAGIYPGKEGWRWTARNFEFKLDPPVSRRARYVELDLDVPRELMEKAAAVTLSGSVNDVPLGSATYVKTGRYMFTRWIPDEALRTGPAWVKFSLDRSVTNADDRAERGLIAVGVGIKEYEQTAEYLRAQDFAAQQTAAKTMVELGKIPPAKAVELRQLFFASPGIRNVQFQGIHLERNPLDLWTLEQVAFETRPRFVIATGDGEGGTALYLAHTLQGLDLPGSRVVAVARKNLAQQAAKNPLWDRYVDFIEGDSTAPGLVTRLAARVKDAATLVLLDAGEDVDPVYGELAAYAALVSRGGYMIVARTESFTNPNHKTGAAGPAEAIRRFLATDAGKNFEVDTNRDLLFLTSTPGGWLRRK